MGCDTVWYDRHKRFGGKFYLRLHDTILPQDGSSRSPEKSVPLTTLDVHDVTHHETVIFTQGVLNIQLV